MTREFSIRPRGAFSLRELALFGFGQRMRPAGVGGREPDWDGVMRLAFCLDGGWQPVGVEVRQGSDEIECVVHGDGDIAAIERQTARVLSLDHDASGYEQVCRDDAVLARVWAAAPGLRPPLFYSPYEAALWSVLSARRPGWQMDRVRTALAQAHGTVFDLAGEQLAAVPGPEQILALDGFDRIDETRLARMQGVARAALDGVLDVAELRAMDVDDAMRRVQQINGIGPMYASLIVIRAVGPTDVLPAHEPRLLDLVRRLYGLSAPPDPHEFARLAEVWRPWRTWCSVLIRSSAARVLDDE